MRPWFILLFLQRFIILLWCGITFPLIFVCTNPRVFGVTGLLLAFVAFFAALYHSFIH